MLMIVYYYKQAKQFLRNLKNEVLSHQDGNIFKYKN